MIEPRDKSKEAVIMEFKVYNPKREGSFLEKFVEHFHELYGDRDTSFVE